MSQYGNRDLGQEYQSAIGDMLSAIHQWWLESGMGLLNPNNPAVQYLKEPVDPNAPLSSLIDDETLDYLPTLDPGGLLGAIKKAPKAIGKLFDDVDDYNKAMKMAQRGEHLKRDSSGQYIGGPKDETGKGLTVKSPQALSKMRRQVDEQVSEGAFNADWYDRARDTYSRASGYNPETMGYGLLTDEAKMASQFSRGGAAYSPQATPPMESENFIRQHNYKVLMDEDIVPRTQSQASNVGASYTPDPVRGGFDIDPTAIKLGKKTGPYGEAKDPTISDDELYKTASDIWHGRVFGYTNPGGETFSRGFTPQEHGFLTGENLLASQRATKAGIPVGDTNLPMTPRRMQAATWGAARFRQFKEAAENRIQKAIEKRKDWDADPRPTTPKKDGGKGAKPSIPKMPSDEELVQRALGGIDQSTPRLTATETFEYVTGESVGHLKGLNKLPESVREEYSQRMQEAFGGDRDMFYQAMQMFQEPVVQTRGFYRNSLGEIELNRGFAARPMTGLLASDLGVTATGRPRRGGPMIDPASREAINTANTVRSIVTSQEAGGWNKFTPATSSMKTVERTGGRFEGAPDELVKAQEVFQEAGLDVANVGDAIHIGRFMGDMDGKEIQKISKKVVKDLEGTYTPGRFETGYNPTEFTEPGAGTATRQLIRKLQGPIKDLGKRLDKRTQMKSALKKANEIDLEFAQRYDLPVREDIIKLRDLISSQTGFEGLPGYVAKHGAKGLPALAPIGLLAVDQEQ